MTTRLQTCPEHADAMMNRRGFFVMGAALTGLLVARPDRAVARFVQDLRTPSFTVASVSVVSTVPAALALVTFAPHVGAVFRASAPGRGDVLLRLVEASDISTPAPDVERLDGEAFSLIFEGSTAGRMEAGQRTLRHADLGWPPLFLSPVGRARGRQDYQAVIDLRSFRAGQIIKKAG